MPIAVIAGLATTASTSTAKLVDAEDALVDVTAHRGLSPKRSAALRKCEILLIRKRGGHFSSKELCKAVNLCERAIERLFRDAYGTNPRRWHLEYRLRRARQDLLAQPNLSITVVAATWGFSELGRFSVRYRRQFGERPLETVRRASGLSSRATRGRSNKVADSCESLGGVLQPMWSTRRTHVLFQSPTDAQETTA